MQRPPVAAILLALLFAAGAACGSGEDANDAVRIVDALPGDRFERPLQATQPPDGTPRLFVVEQAGLVTVHDYPPPEGEERRERRTFIDLSARVSRWNNEEGLLGLAFHPGYAKNGRVFLHYSHAYEVPSERRNVLSEWRVDPEEPDRLDPDSERVLLEVPQPWGNHNGGWIDFGPDGKLYVSLGDGGAGGDPQGNGQNRGTLLGAILRIDVDVDPEERPYGIPPDNPFVGEEGVREEIWAWGLRNAWRCSFDRETGDLWYGDVGQNRFEEVGIVRKGGNHGWNLFEGFERFRRGPVPEDGVVEPLAVYPRDQGISVTGGYVYRGSRLPSLVGAYLYGDYSSGRIWTLRRTPEGVRTSLLIHSREDIASFGEDRDGEILICSFDGRIARLAPVP